MSAKSISVVIVEDDAGIRKMLGRIIDKADGLRFVAGFADAETAMKELKSLAPDVVVMDIQLPGKSGIVCTRRIKETLPETQVVVFTAFGDSDQVFHALKAGASGYLLKRASPEDVVDAIQEVSEGGAPMSAGIARKVVESFREPLERKDPECQGLTAREAEVLRLMAKGYITKEIADQLALSYFTVRCYIRNIYEKLHVRSRTEAVVKFLGTLEEGS